jgi:peptide-methionine (S)-S-oxide reductase
MIRSLAAIVLLAVAPCAVSAPPSTGPTVGIEPSVTDGAHQVAIFAGGCFWCVESAFDDLKGVKSADSGYVGGPERGSTYQEVSGGKTGHTEAVRVVFDPKVVPYTQLLDVFWHNIDPGQSNGQFCDRGTQYRSGLFPLDAAQRRAAEFSKAAVGEKLGKAPVTEITDATTFWVAEGYHQDYHRTNSEHYLRYRLGCGRDARLREIWGAEAGH